MPGLHGGPDASASTNSNTSGQSEWDRNDIVVALYKAHSADQLNDFLGAVFEEVIQSAPNAFDRMTPEIRAAFRAYRECKRAQGGAAMGTDARRSAPGRPQTIPLAYAGKWLAWSEDGLRIVAVGETFEDCERAAVEAGFAPNRVAVDKAPVGRFRLVGDEV